MPRPPNEAPPAGAGPIACSAWRLLLSPPRTGAENMATDVALMERARVTGEAVARIYSWASPTLSFGRNQRTAGVLDRDVVERQKLAVVRRPTGGRAILHHREITYSITAPVAPRRSIALDYAWINTLLVRALKILGVAAEISPQRRRALGPDGNPCFATATPGELTIEGRKLVGSAQYRDADTLLQHGSILVADDQRALAELLGMRQPAVVATLQNELGRTPEPAELRDALGGALGEAGLDPVQMQPGDVEKAADRHVPTFEDPGWTWRR